MRIFKTNKLMAIIGLSFLCLAVLGVGTVLLIRHTYDEQLKPVSSSETVQLVDIPLGASVGQIADALKSKGLIKETWAFEWYVRGNQLRDELKAGTYALRPSQTVAEIAAVIAKGKIATDLVTILPAQRLDQVRSTLINSGFEPSAVDRAMQPSQYANHPALVDKPATASLEGYLYPETFQKDSTTQPEDIIRQSLDQMQKRLTPSLRSAINKQGLNVFEGVTLASILEKEVNTAEDRAIAAQVFLKRFNDGMKLESDVTAMYGAIIANQNPKSLRFDSAYNTHMHTGLPVGPISNVSQSSLQAVANPAQTDYLYFVAGDDGKTYFSQTLNEHNQLVKEHCKKLCE